MGQGWGGDGRLADRRDGSAVFLAYPSTPSTLRVVVCGSPGHVRGRPAGRLAPVARGTGPEARHGIPSMLDRDVRAGWPEPLGVSVRPARPLVQAAPLRGGQAPGGDSCHDLRLHSRARSWLVSHPTGAIHDCPIPVAGILVRGASVLIVVLARRAADALEHQERSAISPRRYRLSWQARRC